MSTSTLILVRHGQSQWNLENRFTGWVDVPLTDRGRDEARQAGQALKPILKTLNHAFTSNLSRAQETLQLILNELGLKPLIAYSEKLNERHYGDLQGKNKAETAAQFGDEQVHIWRRSFDIAPPSGESLKMCAERTLPYFESQIIPKLTKDATVLVVAHGNSLRSIVMKLEKLTKDQVLKLNMDTGVPYVYKGRVQDQVFIIEEKKILLNCHGDVR